MVLADGGDRSWLAACLIVLTGVACYANSLEGEFVFDDVDAIVNNESLRHLGSAAVLTPPPDTTATGRPLLNLSLALDYAVAGPRVFVYHLTNVLLHLCAALMLFALVRGTLLLPAIPEVFRRWATGIALAVASLWVAHPLQTEVVAYVVQRGEALVMLSLLSCLYCLLRGSSSPRGYGWYAGAVVACFLGMMSKESAAVVPVLALLYDRAILAGSWREALRRRWLLYVALAATWVPLGLLVYSGGGRDGTAGFGTAVSPWRYAAAQSAWVLHYLRLCVWPRPLVFDYGLAIEPSGPATRVTATVTLTLLALAVAAFAWRPRLGFLPLAFFVALARGSSFLPILTQVAAERRAYAALAAVVTLAVLAAVWLVAAVLPGSATLARRGVLVGLLVACLIPLAIQTRLRNRDYRNDLTLWSDTAAKAPDNPRAHVNFARALLTKGRSDEAIAHLRTAIDLAPEDPRPHNMLGFALIEERKVPEAVVCFREVVRLDPASVAAQQNLAIALHRNGELHEAIEWYRKVIEAQPTSAPAHFSLGVALAAVGKKKEADDCFRTAVRLDPKFGPLVGR